MYGITHRRRGRTYGYSRCNGHIQKGPAFCQGNSVRVDDLESLLVDELKSFRTRPDRLIDRAKVAEGGVRELEQQRDSLGRQLSTLDHRIERILDAYQDDLIDKELFRKRIDSLQADRSDLEELITQTEVRLEGFRQPDYERTAEALGSVADALEDLDTRDQQKLLRTLVSDVTVQRHHIDCSVISLPSDLVDWNRTGTVALPFCHFALRGRRPPPKGYPTELNSLGDHIRAKRLTLGVSQKEVADQIGMRTSNIWNWENTRCQPSVRFIPGIIDFLGYVPYTRAQSFSDWLKMVRAAQGLSQEALAQGLGMDESTINGWERGKHRPTQHSLRTIRDLLTD